MKALGMNSRGDLLARGRSLSQGPTYIVQFESWLHWVCIMHVATLVYVSCECLFCHLLLNIRMPVHVYVSMFKHRQLFAANEMLNIAMIAS